MIRYDIPIEPEAEQARRWAEEELARPLYHEQLSWWRALLRRISEALFDDFEFAPADLSGWAGLLLMLLLLAGLIVIIVLASRLRRNQRFSAHQRESAQLFADNADAATLFDRAARASRAGDYTTAFLEYFRALIRTADERALIVDKPGLTAQEAARLVEQLPESSRIGEFADMFDAASYGDQLLTNAHLRSLEAWAHTAITHWRTLGPLVDVGKRE